VTVFSRGSVISPTLGERFSLTILGADFSRDFIESNTSEPSGATVPKAGDSSISPDAGAIGGGTCCEGGGGMPLLAFLGLWLSEDL